jgi:hypothetical protein
LPFKFNLRRYTAEGAQRATASLAREATAAAEAAALERAAAAERADAAERAQGLLADDAARQSAAHAAELEVGLCTLNQVDP